MLTLLLFPFCCSLCTYNLVIWLFSPSVRADLSTGAFLSPRQLKPSYFWWILSRLIHSSSFLSSSPLPSIPPQGLTLNLALLVGHLVGVFSSLSFRMSRSNLCFIQIFCFELSSRNDFAVRPAVLLSSASRFYHFSFSEVSLTLSSYMRGFSSTILLF